MKVLLINGSPHEYGCTYTALREAADALEKQGIETEMMYLGKQPVSGCTACFTCSKTGKCFIGDKVNELVEKLPKLEGIIVGSPVYYAAATGQITSFLDRAFMTGGSRFYGKPGAAVVSCRRGGASAAFDQLNKYFTMNNMPVVPSQYWNQVHGSCPDDVKKDLEGLQTMRTLAANMAWLLKSIEAGRKAGVTVPEYEEKVKTSFIR